MLAHLKIDLYYHFTYVYHYIRYLTRLNLQFSLQYVFLSTPALVLTAIYVNSIFWNTVNKSIWSYELSKTSGPPTQAPPSASWLVQTSWLLLISTHHHFAIFLCCLGWDFTHPVNFFMAIYIRHFSTLVNVHSTVVINREIQMQMTKRSSD